MNSTIRPSMDPFAVQTPENLAASDVISLFVSALTDYAQMPNASHTFIYGPRGAGKSMIFRYMEPDCQMLRTGGEVKDLPFYAAYIPIKETELNLSEFSRFDVSNHAPLVINEHLMVANVASKLFTSFLKRSAISSLNSEQLEELKIFFGNDFRASLANSGWDESLPDISQAANFEEIFQHIVGIFDKIYADGNLYIRRSAFVAQPQPYTGPLFGYMDFLAPLVKKLQNLSFMASGPIYLLVDDADNLSHLQTTILNSWVSCRTTGYLCLKISTQTLDYKTYKTPIGKRIESPHDFAEVQICDIYTTKKDTYRERIQQIVDKRLSLYDCNVGAEAYFPPDAPQEQAIAAIREKYVKDHPTTGRGHRPSDDATRYSRPDYIRDLGGMKKSRSSYSYAGFDQLVHISSGVVRHFLEAASAMYSEARSRTQKPTIEFIPPNVQDEIVKKLANKLLFDDFMVMENDEDLQGDNADNVKLLRNLIHALGGTFYKAILSNRSERRVFSIAFTDGPSPDVQQVLNLGVKYGYFHPSSIGNKEGTGRVPLYILNRRLAPAFKLDPTSFAGYLFVKNEAIVEAMQRPKTLLNRIGTTNIDEILSDSAQGELFQ